MRCIKGRIVYQAIRFGLKCGELLQYLDFCSDDVFCCIILFPFQLSVVYKYIGILSDNLLPELHVLLGKCPRGDW